jgi:hypothetical protein
MFEGNSFFVTNAIALHECVAYIVSRLYKVAHGLTIVGDLQSYNYFQYRKSLGLFVF